jgi:hypothetical protein
MMLSGAVPISIRLQAAGALGLRTGELVSVQVLNRLAGDRWAVGIRGRVLPASAKLPLTAGSRLLARAGREGGRLVLRVLDRPLPALRELALREGLPADKATEQILAAFLASGLKVQPGAVRQVRQLLDRLRLPAQRFARLAVHLLEKNIDLASPGVDALLALLGYGEGAGRRKGGERRGGPAPGAPEAEGELRRRLEGSPGGEESPLPLYNHLRGAAEQWVVVPYRFGELSGTIRLLCGPAGAPARRLVLTSGAEGGERWSFVLARRQEAEQGYELHAFSDRASQPARSRESWRLLAQKLQNLGVKSDDTIRVDGDFDGFSLPWETVQYRGVDTVG